MVDFDSELIGVKYELIDWLTDKEVLWFQDYTNIEADITNSELRVYISCEITKIVPPLRKWGIANKFRVYLIQDRGIVVLRREHDFSGQR